MCVGFSITKVEEFHANSSVLKVYFTRKYPLRRYILDMLTHATAWDRHWGGDETLKLVLVYVAWLPLS